MSATAVLIRLGHTDEAGREASTQGDAWLSTAECERLARMRSAPVRQRFRAGHWMARQTLARFAGGEPGDWSLDQDDAGAPQAAHRDGRTAPYLSLSHSGVLLACAVAAAPVGVDVEVPARARDLLRLAAMVFSAEERDALAALAPGAREAEFYRRWTLREAWLKCRGRGLAPARMRSLRLHPVDADGDAWTWQAEGNWLALCTEPGAHITLEGEPGFVADSGWRIKEG